MHTKITEVQEKNLLNKKKKTEKIKVEQPTFAGSFK